MICGHVHEIYDDFMCELTPGHKGPHICALIEDLIEEGKLPPCNPPENQIERKDNEAAT